MLSATTRAIVPPVLLPLASRELTNHQYLQQVYRNRNPSISINVTVLIDPVTWLVPAFQFSPRHADTRNP